MNRIKNNKIENKISNKILKIIVALIFVIICSLVASSKSEAGYMPTINFHPFLFPQYSNGSIGTKNSTYSTDLTTIKDYLTSSWSISWNQTSKGSLIYCALEGGSVKYGEVNFNPIYCDGSSWNFVDAYARQTFRGQRNSGSHQNVNWNEESYNVSFQMLQGKTIDTAAGGLFVSAQSATPSANMISSFQRKLGEIYSSLTDQQASGESKEASTQDSAEELYKYTASDIEYGPTITRSETSGNLGYVASQSGIVCNNSTNVADAFVLSATGDTYPDNTDNKYDTTIIQGAYWLLSTTRNGNNLSHVIDASQAALEARTGGKIPSESYELRNKAYEYEDFNKNISNGELTEAGKNKATIISTDAQIIVDQNNKNYTVGPFVINYKDIDIEDICYIKTLIITTDTGKTLLYSEDKQDFDIDIIGDKVTGSNGLTKNYPASGSKFYVRINANDIPNAKSIDLNVEFEYLAVTEAEYNLLESDADIYQYFGYIGVGFAGTSSEHPLSIAQITVSQSYSYSDPNSHYDYDNGCVVEDPPTTGTDSCSLVVFWVYQPYIQMDSTPVAGVTPQKLTETVSVNRTYKTFYKSTHVGQENPTTPTTPTPPTTPPTTPPPSINLTMDMGGIVWVDSVGGKESAYDGLYSSEELMSGVVVKLYRQDGTYIKETTTVDHSINDYGDNYEFTQLDPMYKYYVEFIYNGQYYEPTTYHFTDDYDNWKTTSKARDIISERESFNAKFEEVGSSPNNIGGSIESYTREELESMGAIDKYGNSTGSNAYADECMTSSMTYTCNGTTKKDLYPVYDVFVVDKYLTDKTSQTSATFATSGEDWVQKTTVTTTKDRSDKASTGVVHILYGTKTGDTYFDAMHYTNLGLVLRQTNDLALKKDVYTATLEINGKTETYKYNQREDKSSEDWEITARISDQYFNQEYTRELYREDYEYKTSSYSTLTDDQITAAGLTTDNELKVYVTYKINIRNQSGTIDNMITELVDYYDQEYTLIESSNTTEREAKYLPYIGDRNGNKQSYVTTSSSSIYGSNSQSSISGYNTTYITGLDGSKLTTGADMYVYLTFRVNKDTNGYNVLDEELSSGNSIGNGKENIVEINGYKSYYGNNITSPNGEYSTGDVAGILDIDSNPGNVTEKSNITKDGNVDFSTFEDDTDKAPNTRIILNRTNTRMTSGTVWNDERTETSSDASVGNGTRDNGETGVNGVKVQLVELITKKNTDGTIATENGNVVYLEDSTGNPVEYIWKELYSGDTTSKTPIIDIDTSTEQTVINGLDSNGNYVSNRLTSNYTISNDGEYKFTSYMPGQYIVRFIYGDGTQSVLGTESTNYTTGKTESNKVTDLINTLDNYTKQSTDTNGYNGDSENIGLNKDSYNGQDYKSTTYQTGIDNGTSSYSNLKTGTYIYDLTKSETATNISDAKDIMSRRTLVENYSSSNVTNSLAEILASGENLPTYNGTAYTANDMANLLGDLMKNTYMVAESGTIDVNLEYNRDGTDDQSTSNIGNGNYTKSGYYSIDNLDFGLEERPKAQLKTTKQVANVKLTLANGTTLFDASKQATNVLWQGHIAHGTDTTNSYDKNNNYDSTLLGIIQTNQMNIPVVRASTTSNGLIQLSMDEELMHGSTIQITYLITVANIGEVDYDDDQFYYTGKVGNTSTIVKTTPNELIDYVGSQPTDDKATRNNLQFTAADNQDWSVLESTDGLVNSKLNDDVAQYTTIIHTTATSKALVPILVDQTNAKEAGNSIKNDVLNSLEEINSTNSMVGVKLVLSQMITSDNSSDDMRYNNMVELVKVSNDVGRRMNYSVVGNQNPNEEPIEIDADDAESVVILPPFGQNYIYYVLGGIVAAILIAGILLVIRFNKKKK